VGVHVLDPERLDAPREMGGLDQIEQLPERGAEARCGRANRAGDGAPQPPRPPQRDEEQAREEANRAGLEHILGARLLRTNLGAHGVLRLGTSDREGEYGVAEAAELAHLLADEGVGRSPILVGEVAEHERALLLGPHGVRPRRSWSTPARRRLSKRSTI